MISDTADIPALGAKNGPICCVTRLAGSGSRYMASSNSLRWPVSHLEDAEVAQADLVAFDELAGDDRREIVPGGFGGPFGQVMPLRQFGGDRKPPPRAA